MADTGMIGCHGIRVRVTCPGVQDVRNCKSVVIRDQEVRHAAGIAVRRRVDHAQQPDRRNADRPKWPSSIPAAGENPTSNEYVQSNSEISPLDCCSSLKGRFAAIESRTVKFRAAEFQVSPILSARDQDTAIRKDGGAVFVPTGDETAGG
jgi:hypothetical protein